MTWKCFKLEYELKSPIHIGYWSKLGIINRTRCYVPGKTMWGAVTAAIGKKLKLSDNENWEKLKNFIRDHLRFSYFYIQDQNKKVLLPDYSKKGIKYNELTKSNFESKYITSYASTAIKKDSTTGEDDSLHEIELIKDKIKEKAKIKTVKIQGYLFTDLEKNKGKKQENFIYLVKEISKQKLIIEINGKEINIFQTIDLLHIGGERNYGYGKIKLKEDKKNEQKGNRIFGHKIISLNEENPEIQIDKEKPIFGHLLITNNIDKIKGELEPLVGREWSEKGHGQKKRAGGIGMVPGSRLLENRKLKIQEYGRLGFKE